MDNIHLPTAASGSSSTRTQDEDATTNFRLEELMAEKDRLEKELKALGSVLESVIANQYREWQRQ